MEGENSLQTPFCEGKIIYFLFPNNNREVINKLMFLFSGHRSGYFLTQQVPIQKSSLNGLKSCFNARSQKSMTLILTSNVNVYLTFFWTKFAHSAMLFSEMGLRFKSFENKKRQQATSTTILFLYFFDATQSKK